MTDNNCYCITATAVALLLLLQVMTRETVSADDVVIKQGDEGDKFYVVDSGCFAVSVIDRKVHTISVFTLYLQLLQLLALIVQCYVHTIDVVDSGCFAVSVIDRKVQHSVHTRTILATADKFYVVDSGCFAVSVIDRKVQHSVHTHTILATAAATASIHSRVLCYLYYICSRQALFCTICVVDMVVTTAAVYSRY
jgi:hypothetical protein